MRWEELFADLEASVREEQRAEQLAEAAELTRAERAQISWGDRVASHLGRTLRVMTPAGAITGRLQDLGVDWLLVDETGRGAALVPTSAVLGVSDLAPRAERAQGIGRSFPVGKALRSIARDRCVVAAHDVAGGVWVGTLDVVGADHVDIAVHPADSLRRAHAVTARHTVPFTALAVVRRVEG